MTWLDELAALDLPGVLEALGVEGTRGRGWGPCFACGAERRGADDKRGPISAGPAGWRCWPCGAAGDAVAALELVALGQRAGKGDRGAWGRVRALAEARGLVHARGGGRVATVAPVVRPRPSTQPPPSYPPAAEVADLWSRCRGVTADADVSAWLEGRGLRPCDVEDLDLARALPVGGALPTWAGTARSSWSRSGHLLVTPLHGVGQAAPVSLRARAVTADPWRKALAPSGYSAAGLVFACGLARLLLTGGEMGDGTSAADTVRRVGLVGSEGEPDFLSWATRRGVDAGLEGAPAVVGLESGAWTPALAACVPDGCEVVVRTHEDEAGDRYAARINQTLGDRCRVLRARTEAQAEEAE